MSRYPVMSRRYVVPGDNGLENYVKASIVVLYEFYKLYKFFQETHQLKAEVGLFYEGLPQMYISESMEQFKKRLQGN